MTKIIIIDNKTIHIEGYKHISAMEIDYVVLQCKNKKLLIRGKNLTIEMLSAIELDVYGQIDCIEWTK